jgi:hypothetical protein
MQLCRFWRAFWCCSGVQTLPAKTSRPGSFRDESTTTSWTAASTSRTRLALAAWVGIEIPVACVRHQRRYVGIEIDPEYVRVARKRIRQLGAGGRS